MPGPPRVKNRATSTPNSSGSKVGGPKKAILAVAASMLTAVSFMLRDGAEFHDLGDQHFAQQDKTRLTTRLLQRLRDLGVEVEVKKAA
jgi:hypothetical protein